MRCCLMVFGLVIFSAVTRADFTVNCSKCSQTPGSWGACTLSGSTTSATVSGDETTPPPTCGGIMNEWCPGCTSQQYCHPYEIDGWTMVNGIAQRYHQELCCQQAD